MLESTCCASGTWSGQGWRCSICLASSPRPRTPLPPYHSLAGYQSPSLPPPSPSNSYSTSTIGAPHIGYNHHCHLCGLLPHDGPCRWWTGGSPHALPEPGLKVKRQARQFFCSFFPSGPIDWWQLERPWQDSLSGKLFLPSMLPPGLHRSHLQGLQFVTFNLPLSIPVHWTWGL